MKTKITFCDNCLEASPQRFTPAHVKILDKFNNGWDVCHKCYWNDKEWLETRGISIRVAKEYYRHGQKLNPETGLPLPDMEEQTDETNK